ncbi:SDR family oxidoreductase [Enteractinococcus fodinae]|uniref:NAD(P)-dependent dehydrogenase (Short-subunit alcohol dehydrogenase family) n=1 Tax=Enteractinococcus fodinae TaxID=684663 RepID=A0ABU2B499_9MICC|nr:SDR family oxidoreductase [Enteractinococcus fodinae]MDR7348434.1 NAD(P)-dependent dehydrogenase (short-subunit alcohol dehydrogenase family) [Enteractinococcus fodinae]
MAERVIVTGGNGGIGSEIINRLEADGYEPISIDLQGPGINADLSDVEEVQDAVAEALKDGPIERIVNNVGGTNGATLEQVDEAGMDELWAINVKAAVFATQALLPSMKARGMGRIVNISSVAAYGKLEKTSYSSTKAAVLGLTKTWALELGQHDITVNAIAPGAIETKMFAVGNPLSDPNVQAALNSLPIQRMGQPKDIANTVAYLLDERTSYVTGQIHNVCGGFTVGRVAH